MKVYIYGFLSVMWCSIVIGICVWFDDALFRVINQLIDRSINTASSPSTVLTVVYTVVYTNSSVFGPTT